MTQVNIKDIMDQETAHTYILSKIEKAIYAVEKDGRFNLDDVVTCLELDDTFPRVPNLRKNLEELVEAYLETKDPYFGWDKKTALENQKLTMKLWNLHPDCETYGSLASKMQTEYPGVTNLVELIRLSRGTKLV